MMKFICIFLNLILLFNVQGAWAKASNKPSEDSVFIYQDHDKKDPFLPLVNSSGVILNYDSELSVIDMELEGIMMGTNGNAVAIVDGRVIKQGDKMGEFLVESIEKNSVIFLRGEEKFELKLKKKED